MKRIIFSKILTLGLIIASSNMALAFNPFESIEKATENVENFFKKAGNEIANIAKLTGQKIKSCSEVVGLGTAWVAEKSGLTAANAILEAVKKSGQAAIEAANKILEGVKKGGEYVALEFAKKNLEKVKSLGKPNYAQISAAQNKVHAAQNRYMAALKAAQARLDEAKREFANKLDDAERRVMKARQKADEIKNSLEKVKRECGTK